MKGFLQNVQRAVKDYFELKNIKQLIEKKEKEKALYLSKLGLQYYNSNCKTKEKGYEQFFAAIGQTQVGIEALKEKESIIKGTIICPSCQSQLPRNASFCLVCGAKVEQLSLKSNMRFCVKCHSELEADAIFCPNCGEKNAKSNSEIDEESEFLQRCKHCGEELKDEDVFCGVCGKKVTE